MSCTSSLLSVLFWHVEKSWYNICVDCVVKLGMSHLEDLVVPESCSRHDWGTAHTFIKGIVQTSHLKFLRMLPFSKFSVLYPGS